MDVKTKQNPCVRLNHCNTILSAKSPDLILRDTATNKQFTPDDVPGSVGGGQHPAGSSGWSGKGKWMWQRHQTGFVRRDCFSHCQWDCKWHGLLGGHWSQLLYNMKVHALQPSNIPRSVSETSPPGAREAFKECSSQYCLKSLNSCFSGIVK